MRVCLLVNILYSSAYLVEQGQNLDLISATKNLLVDILVHEQELR